MQKGFEIDILKKVLNSIIRYYEMDNKINKKKKKWKLI